MDEPASGGLSFLNDSKSMQLAGLLDIISDRWMSELKRLIGNMNNGSNKT